jgi:hypothetical protein
MRARNYSLRNTAEATILEGLLVIRPETDWHAKSSFEIAGIGSFEQ